MTHEEALIFISALTLTFRLAEILQALRRQPWLQETLHGISARSLTRGLAPARLVGQLRLSMRAAATGHGPTLFWAAVITQGYLWLPSARESVPLGIIATGWAAWIALLEPAVPDRTRSNAGIGSDLLAIWSYAWMPYCVLLMFCSLVPADGNPAAVDALAVLWYIVLLYPAARAVVQFWPDPPSG